MQYFSANMIDTSLSTETPRQMRFKKTRMGATSSD